jgi:hypothetical protein
MATLDVYEKVPAEVLDYTFDYRQWISGLGDSPSVSSCVGSVSPAGPTVVSGATDGQQCTVRLGTGGSAGTTYVLTCAATMSDGQVKTKSCTINMVTSR